MRAPMVHSGAFSVHIHPLPTIYMAFRKKVFRGSPGHHWTPTIRSEGARGPTLAHTNTSGHVETFQHHSPIFVNSQLLRLNFKMFYGHVGGLIQRFQSLWAVECHDKYVFNGEGLSVFHVTLSTENEDAYYGRGARRLFQGWSLEELYTITRKWFWRDIKMVLNEQSHSLRKTWNILQHNNYIPTILSWGAQSFRNCSSRKVLPLS